MNNDGTEDGMLETTEITCEVIRISGLCVAAYEIPKQLRLKILII